jgi:hypothetical protein
MHVTSRSQLSLDFEPGLTAKWRSLEDCILHVVVTHRLGVDGIAARLDMSPSELSRRLNAHTAAKEGDVSNRPMRVCDLLQIIQITGDHRPIHWLAERFLGDPVAKQESALEQLAMLAPVLMGLAEQAGFEIPKLAKAARR